MSSLCNVVHQSCLDLIAISFSKPRNPHQLSSSTLSAIANAKMQKEILCQSNDFKLIKCVLVIKS